MAGEKDLSTLIRSMTPRLHPGTYVFVSVSSREGIDRTDTILEFREEEGYTLVLEKDKADVLQLPYDFQASWITLTVHSALDAVGLTAAFSTALGKENISCNVVAGYYHDHLFVAEADAEKAMSVLQKMAVT